MSASPDLLKEWEWQHERLHRELYNEGVGRPYDREAIEAACTALGALSEQWLGSADEAAERSFAIESWAEARQVPFDQSVHDEQDRCLIAPQFQIGSGPLTWHNWKRFERETNDPASLRAAFDHFVECSQQVGPQFEARYAAQRGDFARFNLTPAHTFAAREGTSVAALLALLPRLGTQGAEAFRAALDRLSRQVFGRPAGYAELRALYLNRMYEPLAERLQGVDPLRLVHQAFGWLGFDLRPFPLDLEDRPKKYPGAFCYPVHVPNDVRVSVRIASPHHLLDMLFHEFGHAVHFAGIRPDLPLVDRNWIHSGTHETFSTFFELLLGEAGLLEDLGFEDETVEWLIEFDRFKALLTCTYTLAAGLTSLEAWTEGLDWPKIERRYHDYLVDFTGVDFPLGYARLSHFVASVSVYPVGYVMALLRGEHWRRKLAREHGEHWWKQAGTGDVIRESIRLGGAIRFPDEWLDPAPFLERYVSGSRPLVEP